MKRSEFSEIVNSAALAEQNALYEKVAKCKDSENQLESILATICVELPEIAARVSAEIISKSGLIAFDPE